MPNQGQVLDNLLAKTGRIFDRFELEKLRRRCFNGQTNRSQETRHCHDQQSEYPLPGVIHPISCMSSFVEICFWEQYGREMNKEL